MKSPERAYGLSPFIVSFPVNSMVIFQFAMKQITRGYLWSCPIPTYSNTLSKLHPKIVEVFISVWLLSLSLFLDDWENTSVTIPEVEPFPLRIMASSNDLALSSPGEKVSSGMEPDLAHCEAISIYFQWSQIKTQPIPILFGSSLVPVWSMCGSILEV